MGRLRFAFVASAIFLVTSVLVAASLEWAVRALWPHFHPDKQFRYVSGTLSRPPLGLPNSTLRHGDKAGDFDVEVRINRLGLRDRKDVGESREPDIIALGDSMTMGFGVDEDQRYSNVLDGKIAPRVYNVAIPGDFLAYYNLLRYVKAHQAKAGRLMVGVYPDNDTAPYDLAIVASAPAIEKSPVLTTSVDFSLRLNGLKRYLNRYSALYVATTTSIRKVRPLDLWLQEIGLVQPNASIRTSYAADEFSRSARFLARITSGYDTVVVLLPSRFIWSGDHRKAFRDIHLRMKAALEDEGLAVIDLLPAFDATPDPLQFYFRIDGHWNADGHRLAADAIFAQLKEAWRVARPDGTAGR